MSMTNTERKNKQTDKELCLETRLKTAKYYDDVIDILAHYRPLRQSASPPKQPRTMQFFDWKDVDTIRIQ